MLGYFQTVSWLWEKPWPVMISRYSAFQAILLTWLPVSVCCSWVMLAVFHTRTVLSTVPPAVARIPACHGHHDTALTADCAQKQMNLDFQK